ncbi:VOC family protein [Nonomuraea pusilla]|uniref:VOC domain-containing protein n=1 Tax=Nonomuraea pusilla TaxID=46177 RepID=A0A1H7TPI3_9ACTN|nr:VOC family protein [Nonomuraea pusilla]SEL86760.1 hypothetical protein SAMN05660976_03603 [Nonomuraea pusilla]
MLRGLATVNLWADDVEAAAAWYTEVLGTPPYFRRDAPDGRPAYIEFRLGDYQHELGIVRGAFAPGGHARGPGGAVVYWHVDDVRAAHERLLELGAEEHEPPTDRGPGFVTASVADPFGNVLGVMFNAHYLEVLASDD